MLGMRFVFRFAAVQGSSGGWKEWRREGKAAAAEGAGEKNFIKGEGGTGSGGAEVEQGDVSKPVLWALMDPCSPMGVSACSATAVSYKSQPGLCFKSRKIVTTISYNIADLSLVVCTCIYISNKCHA